MGPEGRLAEGTARVQSDYLISFDTQPVAICAVLPSLAVTGFIPRQFLSHISG
jgi:hypothetical protein